MPYIITQEGDPDEYEYTFFFWMVNAVTNLLSSTPNRAWTVRYVPKESILDSREDRG